LDTVETAERGIAGAVVPLLFKNRNFALLLIFACFVLLQANAAKSATEAAEICDQAAKLASDETGVPYSVLRAISRTETGRQIEGVLKPWAWAVNVEGAGYWFETKSEAKDYVNVHFRQGRRSIDLGCFQVNFHWHGHAFRSLDEMLDPVANARYAATFLAKLFEETGAWSSAVGAYHSRTAEYATRYVARFNEIFAESQSHDSGPASAPRLLERQNNFPLLRMNSGVSAIGSLVPLGDTSRRTLFDNLAGKS
jgi:soluble lytic murein transglycosylase-like protein